jgi:hypothetical protein
VGKLVHAEVDSAALREFLDQRTEVEWVSSALVEVETYRALARATASVDMPAVANEFHALLDLIVRIEIDPGVRIRAQTVGPSAVRSLDATTWPPGCAFAIEVNSPRSLPTTSGWQTRPRRPALPWMRPPIDAAAGGPGGVPAGHGGGRGWVRTSDPSLVSSARPVRARLPGSLTCGGSSLGCLALRPGAASLLSPLLSRCVLACVDVRPRLRRRVSLSSRLAPLTCIDVHWRWGATRNLAGHLLRGRRPPGRPVVRAFMSSSPTMTCDGSTYTAVVRLRDVIWWVSFGVIASAWLAVLIWVHLGGGLPHLLLALMVVCGLVLSITFRAFGVRRIWLRHPPDGVRR